MTEFRMRLQGAAAHGSEQSGSSCSLSAVSGDIGTEPRGSMLHRESRDEEQNAQK